MKGKFSILKEVQNIAQNLENSGFEAFLVGGCVRDLLMEREPKDWDITTNAKPEEIISIFPKTFYENTFGTVGVVCENTENQNLKTVEVTPYRLEGTYSDNRHPDSVIFSQKIEDDLKRRDFTVNSLAYSISKDQTLDYFGGQDDIKNKIIRAVGDPEKRFTEDGLRILRAIRLATELDFEIEQKTEKSILENASLLKNISKERIRDELIKIIMSPRPMYGLSLMKKTGVLSFILPELEKAFGVEQNKAHSFDVGEHLLRSLQHAADKNYPLDVRLAALFHDISKPESRRWSESTKTWTFYGHEVLGARNTKRILTNLRFPNEIVEKVTKLVRWHMFFSDTEQISLSAVRRMIVNVGKENIWDLMDLRVSDRIGTGRPKEDPYRLRKYHSMIEEALRDPISVSMLKIDGKRLMEVTELKAGPKIGFILHALLEEVLDDPSKNNAEYLENMAKNLSKLEDNEIIKLGQSGKIRKEEVDQGEVKKIRGKHWVK